MGINLREIVSKEAGNILLAAIPIYAAAATFLFESGYYGSYGIPLELIKVTSLMMIQFWLLFLFMIMAGSSLFVEVRTTRPLNPWPWRGFALSLIFTGFAFFSILAFNIPWGKSLIWSAVVSSAFLIIDFGSNWLANRLTSLLVLLFKLKAPSVKEEIPGQGEPQKETDTKNTEEAFLVLKVATFAVVFLASAFPMGQKLAQSPRRLPVVQLSSANDQGGTKVSQPSQPQLLVVLYTDGDLFVCEPLRKQNQEQPNQPSTPVLLDRSALAQSRTRIELRTVQFRKVDGFLVPGLEQ